MSEPTTTLQVVKITKVTKQMLDDIIPKESDYVCPTCKVTKIKFMSRYPTLICHRCLDHCTTEDGKPLCYERYVDDGWIFWVNGKKCCASETRFGGFACYTID